MRDFIFRRFKAEIEGQEIGVSVLSPDWNEDGVLAQLRTDGCPLGEGECRVVEWPGPRFKVICQDGKEIQFTSEEGFKAMRRGEPITLDYEAPNVLTIAETKTSGDGKRGHLNAITFVNLGSLSASTREVVRKELGWPSEAFSKYKHLVNILKVNDPIKILDPLTFEILDAPNQDEKRIALYADMEKALSESRPEERDEIGHERR